jgi:DNA-binding transcriptional LysR family regulator
MGRATRGAIREVARQPCILFDREQCPAMYDAILSAAERAGIMLNVVHMLDDPGATSILVSIKPLIGFASASRGMLFGSAAGGVRPVAVQLYDPVPTVDLYAAWRGSNTNPLGEAFLDCLGAVGPFESPPVGRVDARPSR